MTIISLRSLILGGILALLAQCALGIFLIATIFATVLSKPIPFFAPALFTFVFLAMAVCAVLGGYIATREVKSNKVLNGALSAWLYVTSSIWAVVVPNTHVHVSILLTIAWVIAAPLAGAAGGYIRARRHVALL